MFGIGLRQNHYPLLEGRPQTQLDWFEAISENYMDSLGRPLKMLELIRADYPMALHGVGMSLASSSPLNPEYLKKLKTLIQRIDPFIVSDHLCWSHLGSHHLHDLLPFPFTCESLDLLVTKVEQVQDFLQRPLVIENVSSYLRFQNSEYNEWEFLSALVKKTGCQLLLDLNNVFVNAQNHHFDPKTFINNIPLASVVQIHLAGHVDTGEYLFDTHSTAVCSQVWELYEQVVPKLNSKVATLIEWDADIPSFDEVQAQALIAKEIWMNHHEPRIPKRESTKYFSFQHNTSGSFGELS